MPRKEATAVRLRRLRESKQWSIADLAERTGLDRSALYRIETGETQSPQMGTLAELAKVYRVTIGQVRGTEAWPKGGDS